MAINNTGPQISPDPETIKGWNDKRKSNNQTISTMVPFVQLIGLFDEEDYIQMQKMAERTRVPVVFDDKTSQSPAWNETYTLNPKYIADIKRQVEERFINLYIIKSVEHGINVSPINGIVMAENVTQMEEPSGGIGITDLQVDYGKSFLGSRTFVLRITINDPKILDERFEYGNLATFGSSFVIIYGWSNPEVIPGYDAAMSPPKLEGDPKTGDPPTRQRLVIPLHNLGNGGYWSAGRVNILKYDFGFNEMGKLEMTITFVDDTTLGLGSTVMSSIARKFKLFLKGGILDQIITGSTGEEFTLRQALHQRQIELNRQYLSRLGKDNEQTYEEYTSHWADLQKSVQNNIAIEGLKNSADLESGVNDAYAFTTEEDIRQTAEQRHAAQKGYPDSNAMFSYKKIYKTVFDPNPPDDAVDSSDEDAGVADDEGVPASAAPTKQIIDYEKTPVYYYLGAIMDSVALCMAGSQLGIGARKVPSFFYRDVSEDSKLSTAFQSQLKEANRGTSMEERIQEAVIRLKERFLPPASIEQEATGGWWIDPVIVELYGEGDTDMEINLQSFSRFAGVPISPAAQHIIASRKSSDVSVSGTRPVYAGRQTAHRTRVLEAIFPPPPTVGRMHSAPMRGHLHGPVEGAQYGIINTSDPQYKDILTEAGLDIGATDEGGDGTLICYIPDWQKERWTRTGDEPGEEHESIGSEDGYNPLNPNEYRAALPEPIPPGTAEEDEKTFEERSQSPFGRGGRFWMIREYELGDITYRTIMSYENWRRSDRATWNLLQRKWNNLYREYLGDYFESVIRKRINQIEPLGIPIEAIYNEPLDLDWMTGIIYDNPGEGKAYSLKPYEDIAEGTAKLAADFDLEAAEIKLNQDREKYNDIITQKTQLIEGIGEKAGLDPRITSYRAAQATTFLSADSVYHGLQGTASHLVEQINVIKLEIEQLTGGHYERNYDGVIVTHDIMENPGPPNITMVRFKNFDKIVHNKEEFSHTPVRYEIESDPTVDDTILLMRNQSGNDGDKQDIGGSLDQNPSYIELSIAIFEPEIQYEYRVETPKVKEEWVLWNEYNVPTNNFQNQYNFDTTWRAMAAGVEEGFIDRPNKAERWKQENGYVYETTVLLKVAADERIVKEKLNTIKGYQNELNKIYDYYRECRTAIDNANEKITAMERRFEMFTEYFNEGDNLRLSIYDDTSEFDGDGVKLPVGREEPMHLTTKVAQQWHLRFRGITKRGVTDVRNYGAPQGGQKYQMPTNNYEFVYDDSRRSWGVMGQPRCVLDPEIFTRAGLDSPEKIIEFAKLTLSDLSFGVPLVATEDQIFSKDMRYPEQRIDITTVEKGYQNWSLFGSPGTPNEYGNNRWGFKYGPYTERVLASGEIELTGGNYVSTYKDFLNLFLLAYDPDLGDSLRITGRWPSVEDTAAEVQLYIDQEDMGHRDTRYFQTTHNDKKNLIESSAAGIPVYTMMDMAGNILVDDGDGWYHPSGWFLDYAGDPIFLYPSRATACKINRGSKYIDGVRPGGVLQKGIAAGQGHVWGRDHNHDAQSGNSGDRQMIGAGWRDGHHAPPDGPGKGGRSKKWTQKLADGLANYFKNTWDRIGRAFDGDWKALAEVVLTGGVGFQATAMMWGPLGMAASIAATQVLVRMGYRRRAMKKINDGIQQDYKGNKPSWGARIGLGEHCINLTLDMKQSLIYNRPSAEDKTRYLGYDDPSGVDGSPGFYGIDWDAVTLGQDGLYRLKVATDGIRGGRADANAYAEYNAYVYTKEVVRTDADGNTEVIEEGGEPRPAPNATLIGPRKDKIWPPYGNPHYPFGTGWYNGQSKQHGPWVFPEHNKNWKDWSDFLVSLGPEEGYGFFTQVDNKNYTSCIVQPNGAVTNGLELNEGFVKFVIENVFAPLPKNRRCGARPNHKPIKIKGSQGGRDIKNYHENDRLDDVTYQDLFGPLRDDDDDEAAESSLGPPTFGNIDNFEINNVKNIPIRREMIDNMVNKNNTNMSVTQFLGEIFRPGSIGVNNAGNQHLAIRQGEDGTFEVFSLSSINWNKKVEEYAHLFNDFVGREDEEKNRFPEDIMMIDYKASDSLIENVSMNSTFDMLTARAFRDAAEEFTGNSDALLNFMSYKDIAPELQTYFEENFKDYDKNAITIDEGSGEVTLNKDFFMKEDEITQVVKTHVAGYLEANQGRLNAIRALLQASGTGQTNVEDAITKGDNHATQLLANYMHKTTITIHGTTNLRPYQVILVKGVLADLEGLYWITNTRESITPQGFQTIIEGSKLGNPTTDARENQKEEWPTVVEPDEVAILAQPEPPKVSVNQQNENVDTGAPPTSNSGTELPVPSLNQSRPSRSRK